MNANEARDESDLATDRCPDCGALSIESRDAALGAGGHLGKKERQTVPRGHKLTCEQCGRMWTRRK